MADTEVVWRGLTLGGGGPLHVDEITGWDDTPDVDSLDVPRSRGHGDHPGERYSRSRVVTVSGSIASRKARDELAQAILGAATIESAGLDELVIETFGQQLRAFAWLARRSLPVGDDYPSGKVPFSLQFRCPDPLRYGPERTVSTGLPQSGGGMSFPIPFPITFGAPGATGQVTVDNPGTAAAALILEVTGPLPSGFEIAAAGGGRLLYAADVPAGQTVEIDTAEGTVLVEGTADRRANLLVADWLIAPKQGSLDLQFTSLGAAFDPLARLDARWAAAYW